MFKLEPKNFSARLIFISILILSGCSPDFIKKDYDYFHKKYFFAKLSQLSDSSDISISHSGVESLWREHQLGRFSPEIGKLYDRAVRSCTAGIIKKDDAYSDLEIDCLEKCVQAPIGAYCGN